jgi:hypothetical protein
LFRYSEKISETKTKHVVVSEMPVSEGMTPEYMLEEIIKKKIVDRAKKMKSTFEKVRGHYEERVNGSKKPFYDEIRKMFDDEE